MIPWGMLAGSVFSGAKIYVLGAVLLVASLSLSYMVKSLLNAGSASADLQYVAHDAESSREQYRRMESIILQNEEAFTELARESTRWQIWAEEQSRKIQDLRDRTASRPDQCPSRCQLSSDLTAIISAHP